MMQFRRHSSRYGNEVLVTEMKNHGPISSQGLDRAVEMIMDGYAEQHYHSSRMRGHHFSEQPIIIINMITDMTSSIMERPMHKSESFMTKEEVVSPKQNLKLLL